MKSISVYFVSLALIAGGCYYDKFSELHPLDGYLDTCDATAANTYSASINNIIKLNCLSCHSSQRADGNVTLETYSQVVAQATSGKLLGVIQHQSGYQAMPPGTKLRDCEIAKIQAWVSANLPQ